MEVLNLPLVSILQNQGQSLLQGQMFVLRRSVTEALIKTIETTGACHTLQKTPADCLPLQDFFPTELK